VRLWSLHPRYLDPQGLVALWREALLARAVLRGRTRGYVHHPQLLRFRSARAPLASISMYLERVHEEAQRRGYDFDRSKIGAARKVAPIPVTRGQLRYEWNHLQAKLRRRSPAWLAALPPGAPKAHPLFTVIAGTVEPWERQAPAGGG
jgi:hypothetical protein